MTRPTRGFAAFDRYAREIKRHADARRRLETSVACLQDGHVWVNRRWKRIRIAWIDPSYARNLLRYLRARAWALWWAAPSWHPYIKSEAMDPEEWIEHQPLIVHLRQRVES